MRWGRVAIARWRPDRIVAGRHQREARERAEAERQEYAHIVWKDEADLYTQLKNRIGATIGEGPLPKE